MNFKKLKNIVEDNKNSALYMMLPSGEFIPEHFHITEIGKIKKEYIDCGGTVRVHNACSLQVWCANDTHHRLSSAKLSKILTLGETYGIEEDLSVEIEYGEDVMSHYILSDIEVTPSGLLFILTGKKTDCLAPDKCGVTGCC